MGVYNMRGRVASFVCCTQHAWPGVIVSKRVLNLYGWWLLLRRINMQHAYLGVMFLEGTQTAWPEVIVRTGVFNVHKGVIIPVGVLNLHDGGHYSYRFPQCTYMMGVIVPMGAQTLHDLG
jgi:hypothetical protein